MSQTPSGSPAEISAVTLPPLMVALTPTSHGTPLRSRPFTLSIDTAATDQTIQSCESSPSNEQSAGEIDTSHQVQFPNEINAENLLELRRQREIFNQQVQEENKHNIQQHVMHYRQPSASFYPPQTGLPSEENDSPVSSESSNQNTDSSASSSTRARVGLDAYEILEQIGEGTFGSVYKIRRKSDNEILVWKVISYSKMSDFQKEQLVSEVNILRQLQHPNIVRYYDRILDRKNHKIYMIMEYCSGGDLAATIKQYSAQGQYFDEAFIWKVLAQTASALQECHHKSDGRILHRDVKPGNILLDEFNNVKLGDFGLARILESSTDFAKTHVGTPYYMSPEQVSEAKYNEASDIWSLGCLVYEMAALMPPFVAKNQLALAVKIQAGKFPSIPQMYSSELEYVIRRMLQVLPSDRPTIEHILAHPKVFAQLQQIELHRKEVLLFHREQDLARREADVYDRENAARQWELEIMDRERGVEGREKRLEAREMQLEQRIRQLSLLDAPPRTHGGTSVTPSTVARNFHLRATPQSLSSSPSKFMTPDTSRSQPAMPSVSPHVQSSAYFSSRPKASSDSDSTLFASPSTAQTSSTSGENLAFAQAHDTQVNSKNSAVQLTFSSMPKMHPRTASDNRSPPRLAPLRHKQSASSPVFSNEFDVPSLASAVDHVVQSVSAPDSLESIGSLTPSPPTASPRILPPLSSSTQQKMFEQVASSHQSTTRTPQPKIQQPETPKPVNLKSKGLGSATALKMIDTNVARSRSTLHKDIKVISNPTLVIQANEQSSRTSFRPPAPRDLLRAAKERMTQHVADLNPERKQHIEPIPVRADDISSQRRSTTELFPAHVVRLSSRPHATPVSDGKENTSRRT